MKKIIVFIGGLLLINLGLQAQIIDTAKFRLDFRPQLFNFQKQNRQAVIKDTVNEEIHFEYYITPPKLDVSFLPATLSPAKLSQEVMKRYYRDFLKIGFGYPLTPLIELSVHNPDNRKYSTGLNFHHYSSWAPPVGKKMKKYAYYPTSDTRVQVFFHRFFRNQTLYSSVGYNHELANLYGYHRDTIAGVLNEEPDRYYEKNYRDTINNSFHHLSAEVGLRSNFVLEDRKLKQDVRLNYDMISTSKKDAEHHIALTSYFAYDARFMKISGSQNYRLGFDFDYYHNRWNDFDLSGNKIVGNSFKVLFEPTMNFSIKEYHILIGVGVPIIRESGGGSKVPIYPLAELQLGLVPGILNIYAGVNGKVEYNALQKMLYENPFVKPSLDSLKFTRNQISIYGGVKGNLVKKLNYNISARYSYEKDMHFFLLDTTALLLNRFDVVYKNVNMLNVSFNMDWEVTDNLYLNMDANYWLYAMEYDEDKPWYKPQLKVAIGGKYFYKKKMIFDVNMDLEFGRWAMMPTAEKGLYVEKIMKPVLDFGVGFEYLFSQRFSAFARINNIACQNYARYYDFKSYGINVLAGITFSFGEEKINNRKR